MPDFQVTIGQPGRRVSGTYQSPDPSPPSEDSPKGIPARDDAPILVLFHDIDGHRESALQRDLARGLATLGYPTFRSNFFSESRPLFASTVESAAEYVDEVVSAIRWEFEVASHKRLYDENAEYTARLAANSVLDERPPELRPTPPIIAVGHGFGGLAVAASNQLFDAQVLIDPSHSLAIREGMRDPDRRF